jgi:hypothetical protein
MREEATIALTDKFIRDVQQAGYKEPIMILELARHNEALRNLLIGYHYAERGQVCNLLYKEGSLEFETGLTGSFTVEYGTDYFMACSDQSYNNRNKMVIGFKICIENNTLRLFGEEIPERTPDEY